MTVRDEREASFWLNWRKGIQFDPKRYLPGLLDDLEAIDERHTTPGGFVPAVMTDKEAAEFAEKWQAANPAIGVRVKPETVAAPAGQAAAPAKPATRRRRTT